MGEPARLIGSPLAPVPADASAEWFEGQGGVRLRAVLFPAAGARASVVLSPGRTEPIEKYFEVVDDLRGRGFTVLAHDWRGHGLSARLHRDPLRGHARGLADFLADHRQLLDVFEARLPRPWIALGHSMGGGLAAAALMDGEDRFAAAVLSAPMLGIQLGRVSPRLARALARTFSRIGCEGFYAAGPGAPLGGNFEANILTHDRRRWERTLALLAQAPDLQVGGVTWGWLDFAFELGLRLATGPADRIAIPLTVIAAGDERLVDNAPAKAFAERVPRGRYLEIAGAFHELLMETDEVRARFWMEFDRAVEPVLARSTNA